MGNTLTMRSKLLLLVLIALAGLLVVAGTALRSQRTSLLEDRQQKTRNLVEVAHGVVAAAQALEAGGKLSREEAQTQAKTILKGLRYDKSEYFWINDMTPTMIMHPIKPELDGKNLAQTKDPAGKLLFSEFVRTVQASEAGFVDYLWPKPGQDKPVPKLSYVKGFAPWGWIIGSGIYIDDVDQAFWSSSLSLMLVIVCTIVVLLAIGIALARSLIRQLGGEPAYSVQVVKRIAAGHLDTPVQLRAQDQDSQLHHIHDMQNRLRELISQISDSASRIGGMADTVSSRSNEVSSGSMLQSSAAEAMAAAVTQMTDSIQHIAESAELASRLSMESGQLSREGNEVIDRAMAEINRISDAVLETASAIEQLAGKTQTITRIVGVIREVADQTNLLALNAAIEAARAGEQGRGFAVVADEVRKLAERTSSATREISGMIDDIQRSADKSRSTMVTAVDRVKSGVELAGQGGAAVRRIEESAGRVVAMVADISGALQEQRQANKLVAQQVDRIASSADSNANGANAAAAVTTQMHTLTNELHAAVQRFHI